MGVAAVVQGEDQAALVEGVAVDFNHVVGHEVELELGVDVGFLLPANRGVGIGIEHFTVASGVVFGHLVDFEHIGHAGGLYADRYVAKFHILRDGAAAVVQAGVRIEAAVAVGLIGVFVRAGAYGVVELGAFGEQVQVKGGGGVVRKQLGDCGAAIHKACALDATQHVIGGGAVFKGNGHGLGGEREAEGEKQGDGEGGNTFHDYFFLLS